MWRGGGIAARVDMGYDDASQRTSVDRFRDHAGTQLVAHTVEDYDPVGRQNQLTTTTAGGGTIVDYRYTFDLAGQVTSESHHGQSATYTRDLAGQLTGADRTGQPDESYDYDEAGNHTGEGQVVGDANRIASDDRFDYGYDDEGNLVTKTERATGEVTEFTYDYRNRLVSATRSSAGSVVLSEVVYEYDVRPGDRPRGEQGAVGDGLRRGQPVGRLRRTRCGGRSVPLRRGRGRDPGPVAAGRRSGVVLGGQAGDDP